MEFFSNRDDTNFLGPGQALAKQFARRRGKEKFPLKDFHCSVVSLNRILVKLIAQLVFRLL